MATVLLVEDEKIPQFVVRKIVENSGYEIVTAENGTEAIEKGQENIDLILMDIGLPEGSDAGIVATREIRKKGGKLALIPIIALTANATDELRKKMIEAGANSYLIKPTNEQELRQILNLYLADVKIVQFS